MSNGSGNSPARFEIDARDYQALARALRDPEIADGKKMLRDMNAEFRDILKPVMDQMRSEVQGLGSRNTSMGAATRARALKGFKPKTGESADRSAARFSRRVRSGKHGLRARAAASTRIVTKDNGFKQQVGVRITTETSRMPQGQAYLPRGLDSVQGWKHPVFADKGSSGGTWRGAWTRQYGTPSGWFLGTAAAAAPLARLRAERVLEKYAIYLTKRLTRAA